MRQELPGPFYSQYALVNQRADSSQTYIVHHDNVVMGYYSLVFSSVQQEDASQAIRESMPGVYPVPVMLFARFAVDKKLQGRGVGTSLLKDAFLRTVEASEIGGLAAILVEMLLTTRIGGVLQELWFLAIALALSGDCIGSSIKAYCAPILPVVELRNNRRAFRSRMMTE